MWWSPRMVGFPLSSSDCGGRAAAVGQQPSVGWTLTGSGTHQRSSNPFVLETVCPP